MFWNKVYRITEWEPLKWSFVEHSCEFGFMGWTAYFMLRNRKTSKPKIIKVGRPWWIYECKWQLKQAIFRKTGMEVTDKGLRLPE